MLLHSSTNYRTDFTTQTRGTEHSARALGTSCGHRALAIKHIDLAAASPMR